MDVSAVGSNAFLNRHSSRQQMNVSRRQHSMTLPPPHIQTFKLALTQAHVGTHPQAYTLLRIAVIHQLSQYNGPSKGPIFQLKHLNTAVPSQALYHCITFPVNCKHSRAAGWVDDWLKVLFTLQVVSKKMATLSQMTTQKTVSAD